MLDNINQSDIMQNMTDNTHAPYPNIRLFVEARLHAGSTIPLPEAQAHYLLNVMRLKDGEAVALFNGSDGEWSASISQQSKKRADAVVRQQLKPQTSSPDIWYVFAPLKSGKIDYLAQKATELGASALVPTVTRRTIASKVNEERLLANAIEAAEQCERLCVPAIHDAVKLEKLLRDWDASRLLLYGDEAGNGLPPAELFAKIPQAGKYAILVGPEGGFTPEEFALLKSLPFAHAISLGPRILRAETAGLAALTCVMAWRGDWQERPRFLFKE